MTDTSLSSLPAPPLIIRGAQVLLPSGELALREVAIADGKITAIGVGLEVAGDTQVIDGEGLTMLPGVIDAHAQWHLLNAISQPAPHLSAFDVEDRFAESFACVRGGVTSFLEMPNPPLQTTTQAVLD